ncbi:MAG: DUF444 family protein [Betaproteobacteria bacterium]
MVRIAAETPWYELFSRGARDWLRHNQKVREAVKATLSDLLAGSDLMTRPGNRTVAVPVKLLEHSRLRLADPTVQQGAGQGRGEPGDLLQPGREQGDAGSQAGGTQDGEIRFVVELKVEEIIDWLWEELKLPQLKPKRAASMDQAEYVREGLDRRGARSRLDRRRTIKEAVKRRAMQQEPLAFTDDDLRFRQLVRRPTPAIDAVVIFALDVSGSMDETQRRLAKTFFFLALHGIRRRHAKVQIVFLAHSVEAWEFAEEQFFQVSGSGGTVASSAFRMAASVVETRFDPSRYNAYLFYASDGENAAEDRESAAQSLAALAARLNLIAYVETGASGARAADTQIAELFAGLRAQGLPVAASRLGSLDDVWSAIRTLLSDAGQVAA